MAPDFYRALEHSISFIYRSYHFTRARSESINNADTLKLQLLAALKKEWWPAAADSLPQAVTCQLR